MQNSTLSVYVVSLKHTANEVSNGNNVQRVYIIREDFVQLCRTSTSSTYKTSPNVALPDVLPSCCMS